VKLRATGQPDYAAQVTAAQVADKMPHQFVIGNCVPITSPGFQIQLPAWVAQVPPIGAKADFWQSYQGDFGTAKLPGCGLHLDAMFDPYLVWLWANNPPCFEQAMQQKGNRGDNRVAVDPKSGYHGNNDMDLWHDPQRFARFLHDVRAHVNNRGEHFKVLVFMAADGHIEDFRLNGDIALTDDAALRHWMSDIDALAAVTQDSIDATVVCWECRHNQGYISSVNYIRLGRYLAQKWPAAVHAHHLQQESSAWSSPPEADDPNHGSEPDTWKNCRAEGWCDLFLYQVAAGSAYLYPETWPVEYNGERGYLSRVKEIAERLGDDPQSLATAQAGQCGSSRCGWVQVPVVWFEFIYDAYWGDPKATEDYAIAQAKKMLAIGGWGVGSASYRRVQ